MKKSVFIYGFSIFSMFFGSGNLVFPLKIGIESGNFWLIGFAGLFLTGVILPFLGLFVIKLHRGSYDSFFSEAGGLARILLPLFMLSLLGAFGVVPRCITVAYGGIGYIFPEVSLLWFSIVFSFICFVLCLKDGWIIAALGKWLTPILLLCLILLIGIAAIYADVLPSNGFNLLASFRSGFFQGYATMDLFAAFFFSAFMFNLILGKDISISDSKKSMKAVLYPSLVGIGLLSIIYLGLVFMGAYYQSLVISVAPELILPTIAFHLMGERACLIIGIIMVFACLTTAVALNNIYARYLCRLLTLSDKWFPWVLFITTTISFYISLFDFNGIEKFLIPLLEISYPGIIFLTLVSIFVKGQKGLKITLFYGMVSFMVFYKYF